MKRKRRRRKRRRRKRNVNSSIYNNSSIVITVIMIIIMIMIMIAIIPLQHIIYFIALIDKKNKQTTSNGYKHAYNVYVINRWNISIDYIMPYISLSLSLSLSLSVGCTKFGS